MWKYCYLVDGRTTLVYILGIDPWFFQSAWIRLTHSPLCRETIRVGRQMGARRRVVVTLVSRDSFRVFL